MLSELIPNIAIPMALTINVEDFASARHLAAVITRLSLPPSAASASSKVWELRWPSCGPSDGPGAVNQRSRLGRYNCNFNSLGDATMNLYIPLRLLWRSSASTGSPVWIQLSLVARILRDSGRDREMVNSGVATVDGAPAAYRAQGHGLAVVLANGTVALGLHWGAVVPKLSTQRTATSLDDSGSGETAAGGSVQTLKMLADQGAGVAVGANKFDLVGHSLNAALATGPAAEVSQLVRALVPVAGFMWGGEPRLELQFELGLIRTNREAFLRILLMSGLTSPLMAQTGSG
jgi:hypothetical protein